MYILSIKNSGAFLGTINHSDLEYLIDQLEEEHKNDTDYYICMDTVELLEQSGASSGLVSLLKNALGNSEGIDICWQPAA
jgi:hypothetical protein